MHKIKIGNIFLLGAALVWGFGLVSQQAGMNYMGPLTFTSIRCILGGISMLPLVYIINRDRLSNSAKEAEEEGHYNVKQTLLCSALCAVALTVVILSQQFGLLYTSVGKAGFITALYIMLVPVSGIFLGKKVSRNSWIGMLLAIIAMYLLCISNGFDNINFGDILMFAAAIAYTCHLHLVDNFISKTEPVMLSCFQFIMVGVVCIIPAIIFEGGDFSLQYLKSGLIPLLYASLASCAVGYTFQILGQKTTDPNTASILLSTETVFGLAAAWLILGEVLTVREYVGCAIMLVAIIVAQLPERDKTKN